MYKILIIGCGNIGSVFAFYLARSNKVFIYEKDSFLKRILARKGIKIIGRKRISDFTVIDNLVELKGTELDLIIFATKAYDVYAAAEEVCSVCETKAALFIQNGFIDMRRLKKKLQHSMVYRGVTTMAAHRQMYGEVNIFNKGTIYLGSCNNNNDDIKYCRKILRNSNFNVIIVSNYNSAVWAKAILNAVVNPIPVFLRRDYQSIVPKNRYAHILFKKSIEEGREIARKMHIRLSFDPWRIITNIKKGRYGRFNYMGSMYYDFYENRKTEIENITGALLKIAKKMHIKTPYLETIYYLMKILENDGSVNKI